MEGGRGRYWTEAEVAAMLDIFIENRMGPVLFHLQPRRNEHAFRLASHQLARLNYARTPTQIRSKFKTLRQNFNRCLFYFGEGAEERNQSAYWGQLLSLWVQADRPHPANLFPAGAGPARRLGQRREALGRQGGHGRRVHLQEDAEVPERLPDQFVEQDDDDQGLQGNIPQEEPNAPDVGAPPEPEHAARGEQQEDVPEQPLDIMQEAVRRAEMENWGAILQDVVQRVAVLEEHILGGGRGRAAQRRRRRRI